MDKKVIILFGPPGAGKGTQSELLSEKMGLYLFETSKILEREFKRAEKMPEDAPERFVEFEGEKFDVLNEKEIWKRGELCSPPWVTYLCMREFKRLFDDGDNLVISLSASYTVLGEPAMTKLSPSSNNRLNSRMHKYVPHGGLQSSPRFQISFSFKTSNFSPSNSTNLSGASSGIFSALLNSLSKILLVSNKYSPIFSDKSSD